MPMLILATNISPILGVLMSIALLGMIYNTAVGMLLLFVSCQQKASISNGLFG